MTKRIFSKEYLFRPEDRRGSLLILSLWALLFLSTLAVTLAFGARQKIQLALRLEHRVSLQSIAEAGAYRAIHEILRDPDVAFDVFADSWATNSPAFRDVVLKRGLIDHRLQTIDHRLRSKDFSLKSTVSDSRKWGFTLIELMVVIVIIGALVAMVMPRLVGRGEQAKVAASSADIRANIATALKLYELDNGSFPATEQGLDALMNRPVSGVTLNWNGPYLEHDPVDPWGRTYEYVSPGQHHIDYDLFSLGRDGISGTEDDVTNWDK